MYWTVSFLEKYVDVICEGRTAMRADPDIEGAIPDSRGTNPCRAGRNAAPLFLRWILLSSIGLFSVVAGTSVRAEFPERAIKLIVPYPAGGPTDVLARRVGDGRLALVSRSS